MLGAVQCGREAGSQVSVESLFCGSGTHPLSFFLYRLQILVLQESRMTPRLRLPPRKHPEIESFISSVDSLRKIPDF